jgi:hypothetical protein
MYYHFVHKFIEDGFINIELFQPAENDADIFTKNVNQEFG